MYVVIRLCLLRGLFLLAKAKPNYLDLRHHGLKTVPNNIKTSTVNLDLSVNLLTIITNNSFSALTNLTYLGLSHNHLEKLEPLAFSGLSKLKVLNLSENRLLLTYDTYPPGVFHPLLELIVLNLRVNIEESRWVESTRINQYPEKIFSRLHKLRHLEIDGLGGVPFGPGFLRMSQLNSISIDYGRSGCFLELATIAVFLNLTIESLTVMCNRMENGILQRFVHLKSLQLIMDDLNGALGLLAGMDDRNFTRVSITGNNVALKGRLVPENLVLTKNNTVHLATMCIKQLDLSHNFIIHLSSNVFTAFRHPECLESLDLGGNYLRIASHFIYISTFARFPNLKYINLSSGHGRLRKKRNIPSDQTKIQNLRPRNRIFQVSFPPSIEVINGSYLYGRIPNLPDFTVTNGNRLLTLDLAYLGIQDCSFRVTGLVNLRVLNISGSDCSGLSPEFFTSFSSLVVLVARDCHLVKGLKQDSKGIVFRPLKHLRTLDISDNNLIVLSKYLFQPLVSLENLLLANNKLIHLPESILTLKSLSSLDVSSNVISSLSVNEQNWFYKIQSALSTELRLSLSENPLLCTCETLSFLHWVLSTEIYLVNNTTLSCTLQSGQVTNIWNLRSQLKDMDVKCVSKFWLSFSVVGSSVLTISLILGIFGYRYRWNIKYWFLTKCRRSSAYEEVELEQYQYDAFVAYNYQNYQWACITLREILETENNYSLCLHDRDFPVGVSIQQNIVDAVNNSRKVILVINRAFLTSDWCEFEIQMAGMRMVRDGRENAIIVIMMEEIPVSEMPRSLLNLWKHITFLLWNNDQTDERMFWDRLLEVMARP